MTQSAQPNPALVGRGVGAILAALMLALPGVAHAQGCCSPSTTPVSALHAGPTPTGTLDLGLFYEYFRLRGDLNGTTTVPDPQDRLTQLHVANLVLGYAPWNRLGFRAVVPFARRSREQTLATPTVNRRDELVGTGLGDITLLAQWRLFPLGGPRPYDLSLGAGVKLGTGAFHENRDGVQLPLDLQPGTGCEDFIATGYGQYYRWVGWNAFGGTVWRMTGTNGDGYRYGNEGQLFAGASRELGSTWLLTLESRYRHASPDRRNGAAVSSTGNDRLFLVPGVGLRAGTAGLALLASVLVPVYEQVNGTQLGTSIGVNVALEYQLKHSSATAAASPQTSLHGPPDTRGGVLSRRLAKVGAAIVTLCCLVF